MGINNPLRNVWARLVGVRLAIRLDNRLPGWCWAHICTDLGLGWDIWNWRRARENSCAKDCERDGACWCGKMVKVKVTGA